MKNLPDKIYLQFEGADEDTDFDDCNEVTWCQERINQTDIEYTLNHDPTTYRFTREDMIRFAKRASGLDEDVLNDKLDYYEARYLHS